MSSSNGKGPSLECLSSLRTERPSTYGSGARSEHGDNAPDCRQARTEQPSSNASPLGVDGAARAFTAHLFDATLLRRWENEEEWASNRCIAERFCKNSESIVRRWRLGEKMVPLAALRVLPVSFGWEMARGLLDDRGGAQRPLVMLRETIQRLDRPVAEVDKEAVMRALLDAQRAIGERIARLATEGR